MFQLPAHIQASLHSSPRARASPSPAGPGRRGPPPLKPPLPGGPRGPRQRRPPPGRPWALPPAPPGASRAGDPQPERVSVKPLTSASPGQTPARANLGRAAEAGLPAAPDRSPSPGRGPRLSARVGLSEDDPGGPPDPLPRPRLALSPDLPTRHPRVTNPAILADRRQTRSPRKLGRGGPCSRRARVPCEVGALCTKTDQIKSPSITHRRSEET